MRASDKGERRDVAQRRLEPLDPLAEDGIGLVRAVEAEDAEAAVAWCAHGEGVAVKRALVMALSR